MKRFAAVLALVALAACSDTTGSRAPTSPDFNDVPRSSGYLFGSAPFLSSCTWYARNNAPNVIRALQAAEASCSATGVALIEGQIAYVNAEVARATANHITVISVEMGGRVMFTDAAGTTIGQYEPKTDIVSQ